MSHRRLIIAPTLLVLCISFFSIMATAAEKTVEIGLSLSDHVCDRAMTGRVFVLFDRFVYGHPLSGPDGSERKPFFGMDVKDWTPGKELSLTSEVAGFPVPLNQLPAGRYAVQAILDTNTVVRDFADAPENIAGRIYSDITVISIHDSGKSTFDLILDKKGGGREFGETRFIKEVRVESMLLTAFGKRRTTLNAAVILPPSYFEDTTRKYATVYCFPAFGKRHYCAVSDPFYLKRFGTNMVGLEKVFVLLDQAAPLGCHVFANSENNGPWASAFVDELVPYIEQHFRVYANARSRFLTGQSSGAWASLWLQVNYPDRFAGAWAASPDPVDFTSFCGVDIYEAGANLFVSKNGDTLAMNKILSDYDRAVGPGWQMGSFEAVFSPRAEDGLPRRLWDRNTGSINEAVAATWKPYDLRLVLEKNWQTLAPVLDGKLHIYVAENDRFGLAAPVQSLQQAMTQVKANLDINIFQKGGHDLWSDELRETIHKQIDEIIVTHHPEAAQMRVTN